ncbi:thioesterase family protein [Sphaerotilus sulfidivorans]|uniref:Thioesterase family protein n=1 Tax=Sphaerotilus sulfidivorans TaxID=639200 RepID=A0A5C1Q413_9BURK|nr:thioesterase family protein [Sphaerotilus sulfidivorans]QEN00832.1 thioesterase family protein [Sphaerotilus sulfidivorans]
MFTVGPRLRAGDRRTRGQRGKLPHDPRRPPHPRTPAEQARLHLALTELWEQRLSFNQLLGLKVDSLDPDHPRLRLDMRPELVGHFLYGRLHGGVISAALDAAAGFALTLAIARKHPHEPSDQILQRFSRVGTIDLRVDYLRPGLGAHFIASAEVTRLGGRVASSLMRMHNHDGLLIATGAAAYVVS